MADKFITLWRKLRAANQALHNDSTKMTITVASFRSQLKRAYEQGGADTAAMIKELEKLGKKSDFDLGDIFVFGQFPALLPA